jgi:hypothetical protein
MKAFHMRSLLPLLLIAATSLAACAGQGSASYRVSAVDDRFLEDLERRCYRYFEESAHPETGLIADRWPTDGGEVWDTAGIAAVGFGLTGHAIAAERGWIPRDEAEARCRKVLIFLRDHVEHKNGFFYQWIDRATGERAAGSPASSIDNALLLAGAITAAQAFPDSDLGPIVDDLYRRMDWQWMLNGNDLLNHGWNPEVGFLETEWSSYCELMILVLLAIGAEEHAIPPQCWDAWKREPKLEFQGEAFAHYPPLFVHQYSQAYFDFRNFRDRHLDYWRNSQVATLAQIDYMKRLGAAYPEDMGHYSDALWGLTASDAEGGAYRDWGAPYKDPRLRPWRGVDGTLVPSAPGGSLALCPEECLRTLKAQKELPAEGEWKIFGRYGFANAHNPRTGWVSHYCLAIDTGITLLMAENLRSGFVWETFMSHPAASRAFERAGFKEIK